MQTIYLAGTSRQTTRLGFGCSSVMGAMGRKESLKMLEAAYDEGIRHFDVAPMYGYGRAEECLGEFWSGHKTDVTVTTKYGIAPPKNGGLFSVARKIAGPVVKMLPGLKAKLAKAAASAVAPSERASFSGADAKASLERSLVALKTERIDVWLLHEVEVEDLRDESLLRFMEDSVASGVIGTFGVGSEARKVAGLLKERPEYCRVLQCEWSVLDAVIGETKAFRFHHRSLTENFRNLHQALVADATTSKRWSDMVDADVSDRAVLAKLMLKAALVENPASVILVSSKNTMHIAENVRVVEDASLVAPAKRLYALVQAEGVPGNEVVV